MCKEYIQYSVGSKIDRPLDDEGGMFEIQDNVCHCIMGMRNITEQEAEAVSKGKVTVALSDINGIIFVIVKIDDILAFDMPFNMGNYDEFQLKEPNKGGYLMPIVFVDVDTQIIRAIRLVGFKNDFCQKLYELSQKQWECRITDYNERVNNIYKNYPTQALFKQGLIFNVFEGVSDTQNATNIIIPEV